METENNKVIAFTDFGYEVIAESDVMIHADSITSNTHDVIVNGFYGFVVVIQNREFVIYGIDDNGFSLLSLFPFEYIHSFEVKKESDDGKEMLKLFITYSEDCEAEKCKDEDLSDLIVVSAIEASNQEDFDYFDKCFKNWQDMVQEARWFNLIATLERDLGSQYYALYGENQAV